MRELVKVPDPILRQKCRPVVDFGQSLDELIQHMMDFMDARKGNEVHPVSLAAPQLGELLRVIAFYPNPQFREKEGIEVLVNPTIKLGNETYLVRETCLSIPGKAYIVSRAKWVKVKGTMPNGSPKSWKASGLLFAQLLQHEINHLDGVLIDSIGSLTTGGVKWNQRL